MNISLGLRRKSAADWAGCEGKSVVSVDAVTHFGRELPRRRPVRGSTREQQSPHEVSASGTAGHGYRGRIPTRIIVPIPQ